jgi:hypothetical protein
VLHAQSGGEGRQADQPERQEGLAVEGVVQEAGEVREEAVGEELCLVEDQDRKRVLLLDEVDDGALEVPPELGTPVRGLEAELQTSCGACLRSLECEAQGATTRVSRMRES